MSRTELKNKNYSKELAAFIRSGLSKEELRKRLSITMRMILLMHWSV